MEEDRLDIETPEHVRFSYEIAGIGSRFIAAFMDYLLQTVAMALFAIALAAALSAFPALGERSAAITVVVVSATTFIYLGYFIVFEMIWNGQSPGKRAAGIRVIRNNGTPITITESLIRNLLRVVDFLPVAYGVGILSILLSKQSKRIGDFAAGTVVVRESSTGEEIEELPAVRVGEGQVEIALPYLAQLSEEDLTAIQRFMERRDELDPRLRREMAMKIAAIIADRLGGQLPASLPQDPEALVEVFYAASVRRQQNI